MLAVAAAALAGGLAPAASAAPGTVEVGDLVLPVLDLDLPVASLDGSIVDSRIGAGERVRLAGDVLFAFGRARLTSPARALIAQTAARIRSGHAKSVRVDGYTDSKGSPPFNRALSRRRAQAVARALRRALGAAAPRLLVRGHGETDPVAANTDKDGNDNPKGRAANRRVEVSFGR